MTRAGRVIWTPVQGGATSTRLSMLDSTPQDAVVDAPCRRRNRIHLVGGPGIGQAGRVANGIELVVTDLDGTLWETPATTPVTTVDAVTAVLRRGYPLLVATGRRLRSTRSSLDTVLGRTPPAVVLNGGLVVDLDTDERLHSRAFPPEVARKVLSAFRSAGLSPCLYVDGVYQGGAAVEVFTGPEPSTHPDHLSSLGPWAAPADLEEVVETHPVYFFGLLGQDRGEVDKLEAELTGVASPTINPDRENGGFALNVGPPGVSKWDGVEAFCRHAGLDPSAVLALGDGSNDVELLAGAAVALVPEDGTAVAHTRADHVIPRAADGGWAAVLDHLP